MNFSKCSVCLLAAIIFEVVATTLLTLSQSFQRPVPGITALILYAVSYYFLSLSLRRISVGVAYAIWSATGISCIALIRAHLFGYDLHQDAWIGFAMIIIGTLILNLAIRKKN